MTFECTGRPRSLRAMERQDPLKIILGSLSSEVHKPKILALLEECGLNAVDVIVPQCKPGKLAVAFITFASAEEASWAIQMLNGAQNPIVSPWGVKAHK